MFQIRIHGRRGQGVITAAELLSLAAFEKGSQAEAGPGGRSGGGSGMQVAWCRIGSAPIRAHGPVTAPDAVLIQDATVMDEALVFAGLRDGGCALINTTDGQHELGLAELGDRLGPRRLLTVPASEIASRQLQRPLPNTALLGGFTAMCREVSLQGLIRAIALRFSGEIADRNMLAADVGHEFVLHEVRRVAPT